MSKISPRRRTEDDDDVVVDLTMPWGVYVPPSSTNGGYVRIVDARGKSFPCGFSRQVGHVVETATAETAGGVVGGGKKRSRCAATVDDSPESSRAAVGDDRSLLSREAEEEAAMGLVGQQHGRKRTVTEEHLHPEEALFLHLRGLLRIVSSSSSSSNNDEDDDDDDVGGEGSVKASACNERRGGANHPMSTLTTHDLFFEMLHETNVSLAAYLAYAHLRSQGYILVRYTERRMALLREIMQMNDGGERPKDNHSSIALDDGEETMQTKNDAISPPTNDVGGVTTCDEKLITTSGGEMVADDDREVTSHSEEKHKCGDDGATLTISSEGRFKSRALRLRLSEDVATAPTPFVVLSRRDDGNGRAMIPPDARLAYYAYNPNSRFRRTNPGLPDFGVAVMPYNDNQPTFDALYSLALMCEKDAGVGGGIPLRVVTVADGGAVVAFGVTNGEVPTKTNFLAAEALILGTIPTTETYYRKDGMFCAYYDLPVLWVDHYDNIAP
ncbi:hypothetical protein ACHAXA_002781 [Cyclostephanos tholiformis]|uniref:tRNA-splicing endonuclease subunit Sen54 N-terminal domain-containing protein n=1 Tax=Cyclostephanos tholiformis TaxID=382380 RepID=A0ABD3RH59_9STRA